MPSRAAKRGMWAVALALLIAAATVAVLPIIASTRIVRDRIAQEMGLWSGYQVTLDSAPEIEIWPVFRAHLNDVTFREWGEPEADPVLEADDIVVDLSALAALSGRIVFSRILLDRPVLRVERGAAPLPMPAAPGGGRMWRAVATARTVVEANPAQPDMAQMPSAELGVIEFRDARILVHDVGGYRDLVSGLGGKVTWPALNRAATLTANGIWRGETLSLDVSASQPLALFAGGNAQLKGSMKSALLTASFDGLASIAGAPFVDGTLSVSTPSLRRTLEWSRAEIAPGSAVGAFSFRGRATGDASRLKFAGAEIQVDGNAGTGVVEIARTPGKPPAVSGTLAFETLDIVSFLSAFAASGSIGDWPEGVDPRLLGNQLSLDLRLSATTAKAGPATLANVAGTAQVRDGLAAFDISDAAAFGGSIQAGIRLERKDGVADAEFRMLAEDVDTLALALTAGMKGVAPQGKGSLSVILKGPVHHPDGMLGGANGTISARMGQGAINGIDLNGLLTRTAAGGFFPLSELSKGSLPIETAEFKANVANGVMRIDTARAVSGARTISLSGIVPYVGRGLALSGSIAPKNPADGNTPDAWRSFFVGGSWSAPFVSPVFATPPLE